MCVCSGCTLCYISIISAVYGVLYRSVCVGTRGLCSPDCGRGVRSRGSWWRFKVLGVVCVCDRVSAYAATQHLMLLMMGVCTQNMSS